VLSVISTKELMPIREHAFSQLAVIEPENFFKMLPSRNAQTTLEPPRIVNNADQIHVP
jgi:hypothetical protein